MRKDMDNKNRKNFFISISNLNSNQWSRRELESPGQYECCCCCCSVCFVCVCVYVCFFNLWARGLIVFFLAGVCNFFFNWLVAGTAKKKHTQSQRKTKIVNIQIFKFSVGLTNNDYFF
jgi:hypothetical protein